MSTHPLIEEVHFNDAKDFLDYLRLSSPAWNLSDGWDSHWIFRGQSDSSWDLIPSAWRDNPLFQQIKSVARPSIEKKYYDESDESHAGRRERRIEICDTTYGIDRIVEHSLQCFAESMAVRDFISCADRLGLRVEGFRDCDPVIPNYSEYGQNAWPNMRRPHDGFALAQHHGIQTRLLDWTWSPLIAAFFAAEGIGTLSNPKSTDKLAVWAFDTLKNRNQTFELYQCPRYQFSFLSAQRGLFTWLNGDWFFLQHGKWPSFSEILQPFAADPKPLRKITVCIDQAERILSILWRDDITRAHLMPTYDNIATHLKTIWKWRKT